MTACAACIAETCTWCPFPRPYPTGNPTTSEICTNATKRFKRELSNHVIEGADQLTPWELKDLLDHFISLQTKEGLLIATFILLHVTQGFRNNDFGQESDDDFLNDLSIRWDLSAITDDLTVKILCVTFKPGIIALIKENETWLQ